jgi:hypothetical protein
MANSTLKLNAPWPHVKEMLKENNIELTDEDLEYKEGQEDVLLERLSFKMNKDKQAVKDYIESVSSNKGKAS